MQRNFSEIVASGAVLACAAGLALGGCGQSDRGRAASGSAPDTTREGKTVVVRYDDGPVDELRLVRDTSGAIVVEGLSGFPDGTKIVIALLDPGGSAVAASGAVVETGRFATTPLIPRTRPAQPIPVTLRMRASFRPGEQSEEVLRRTADGRRFRGAGMSESPDGYAVYQQRVEVEL